MDIWCKAIWYKAMGLRTYRGALLTGVLALLLALGMACEGDPTAAPTSTSPPSVTVGPTASPVAPSTPEPAATVPAPPSPTEPAAAATVVPATPPAPQPTSPAAPATPTSGANRAALRLSCRNHRQQRQRRRLRGASSADSGIRWRCGGDPVRHGRGPSGGRHPRFRHLSPGSGRGAQGGGRVQRQRREDRGDGPGPDIRLLRQQLRPGQGPGHRGAVPGEPHDPGWNPRANAHVGAHNRQRRCRGRAGGGVRGPARRPAWEAVRCGPGAQNPLRRRGRLDRRPRHHNRPASRRVEGGEHRRRPGRAGTR